MTFWKTPMMLTICALAFAAAHAQDDVVTIDAGLAAKHLTHKVEAQYPPPALAQQVSGEVKLRVLIDPSGKVVSCEPLSGPALLWQAAVDAVKQWEYAPFAIQGKAFPATAEVSVTFSIPKPEETKAAEAQPAVTAAVEAPAARTATDGAAAAYSPLSEKCHALMGAGGDPSEIVAACADAAAASEKFPADSHYVERRAAYVFYSAALLRARQYPEAEEMAERAVAVVAQGHDDASGSSAAYAVLGNVQALNGQLADADKNLETAEQLQGTAMSSSQAQLNSAGTLRTILLFHADTLDRIGNTAAAAAKRAEAEKLLPAAN